MQNHSYENVFYLRVHFHANQTNFHMKSFARRLVLRQSKTRPIDDVTGGTKSVNPRHAYMLARESKG